MAADGGRNKARVLAWAIAASLLVLHVDANAKGGRGGGHCSTGHASASHAGHSRSGSSTMLHSSSASRTTAAYGAGRVLEDGTYVEPGRDCTPDRPCDPNAAHGRPTK